MRPRTPLCAGLLALPRVTEPHRTVPCYKRRVRVVFATAELAPFVKVGGLGDAAAGLVVELRRLGVDVEVVLPDYGGLELAVTSERALEMPAWAGPATIRTGSLDGFAGLTLVSADDLERPHPYLDRRGRGWPDNDRRFMVFSAALAAHLLADPPDLVHLNDWHTGATLGLTADPPPSLLTIHNLAYQGITDDRWLAVLTRRPEAYEWYGDMNPLTGAIALADRVVAVSPHFAEETLRPESGFGVDEALAARGPNYLGILNGIDTSVWDPATDPLAPAPLRPAVSSPQAVDRSTARHRDGVAAERRAADRHGDPSHRPEGGRPGSGDRGRPGLDGSEDDPPRRRRCRPGQSCHPSRGEDARSVRRSSRATTNHWPIASSPGATSS